MPVVVSHRHLLGPKRLSEALKLLHDDAGVVPIAGCTDVYVTLNFGALEATRLLNLWPLDELRGIERRNGTLRIGALTTYSELIRSTLINRELPMLVAAAKEVGGVQIQNRGTLGGNVANASPAGDTLPVLAAAEALVELRSVNGTRTVPFDAFYAGYRKSVAAKDELITAFVVPPVRGTQWFRKVGTRAAQAISKVVIAAVDGESPRVALGSVAPTVVRLPRTELALAERRPISEAQAILNEEIAPIDDVRSTAEYRRRVAANLLAAFVAETAAPRRRGRR